MAAVGTPGAIRQPPPTSGSYGQGISYPMTPTPQGRLQLASGAVLVKQQLQSLWECGPGERPMLPKFGCAVGEFEPVDMAKLVERYKRQVADYIPAVDSVQVDTQPGPGQGEATVIVTYTLTDEDTEHVLTFPIFVGP